MVDAAVQMRDQFNAITAFIDMSSIYASDKKWQTAMRSTSFDMSKCRSTSESCRRQRCQKYCPGTMKEHEGEKGLPTRKDLGTLNDFMPGQSGEFKVSSSKYLKVPRKT